MAAMIESCKNMDTKTVDVAGRRGAWPRLDRLAPLIETTRKPS